MINKTPVFIVNDNLTKYGFIENENLRTDHTRTYIYKAYDSYSGCYYYDFDFIVNADNTLTFDTSAYGLNEYDLAGFANIFYKLIKKGVISYKKTIKKSATRK